MSISRYVDKTLGKEPCKTQEDTWRCPNMKPVSDDMDMSYERYECKLCGRTEKLDYEEIS